VKGKIPSFTATIWFFNRLKQAVKQPDGKADGKIALKPGDFGIRRSCTSPVIFSKLRGKACEKPLSV